MGLRGREVRVGLSGKHGILAKMPFEVHFFITYQSKNSRQECTPEVSLTV